MVYRSILIPIVIFFSTQSYAKIDVPEGYQKMAKSHSIPPEILYSVAMTESNYKLPDGSYRPWPWTINVAGTGYRYDSRQEAYDALVEFMKKHPLKRIDVGIAQVNLGWNGHYFRTYWDAFEPYTNLNAASQILKYCFDNSTGHSWLNAAGCYHHPAGGKHAERYKSIVKTNLQQLEIPEIPSGLGIDNVTLGNSLTTQVNTTSDSDTDKNTSENSNELVELANFMLAEQINLLETVSGINSQNEDDNESELYVGEFDDNESELYVNEPYVNEPTFEINIPTNEELPIKQIAAPKDGSIWIEPDNELDTQLVWVDPKN